MSLIRISESDDLVVDDNREYGHWILRVENNTCDMTYQYECNKCGQPLKQKFVTNFCPNCKIIMDEEIEMA